MKKVYYQLKLYQKSPLRIGNGDHEMTDSDLMVDGRGRPFIPGSSVAGVLRDLYMKKIPAVSEREADQLFGYIEGEVRSDSHVLVSDAAGPAHASSSDYLITVRDGIRLDEWGIAVPGHKYDFQVTETRELYCTVLEWTGDEAAWRREIAEGLDPLLRGIAAEGLSFGARTTRGYGNMSVTVKEKRFDFPQDMEKWLAFDPFAAEAFEGEPEVEPEAFCASEIKIHAEIEAQGSFCVPLCNYEEKPLIPGTSWAGVFRHHMLSLLGTLGLEEAGQAGIALNRLFGMEAEEGEHIRSGIRFGETIVQGASPYSLQRNAVDRFTQAPRNTALFVDELWQGGEGELEIFVDRKRISKLQAQLLAVSLIDLDLGLMTVGGKAGVGHGICRISCIRVNGKDVTEQIKKQDTNFLEEYL